MLNRPRTYVSLNASFSEEKMRDRPSISFTRTYFVFPRLKSLRISAVNNISNHAKIVQGPRLVREFGGSETMTPTLSSRTD